MPLLHQKLNWKRREYYEKGDQSGKSDQNHNEGNGEEGEVISVSGIAAAVATVVACGSDPETRGESGDNRALLLSGDPCFRTLISVHFPCLAV